jgi:O-antigen/teichoic acid export membrane protein
MPQTAMTSVRERLVRGLISGLVHEAFSVVLSVGAMLVLVRLLTPADYGEAAAVAGVLALVRAFSGALFVEHALQHAKDTEPDWTTYFTIVGLVQLTLFAATNAIGLVCRASGVFADVALLLHLASVGLLLDWPAQVASVKLRRELRFQRLKLLSAMSLAANLTTAIALAWWGLGAVALIVSGNVVSAVPMAASLFLAERWRPRQWLSIPPREDARPIVQFARQQIAAGIVHAIRSAAESILLTRAFGVSTLGLINRALVLFQSTIGRLSLLFVDTAYPLLPMERNDPRRYAARAARFLEVALMLAIPGGAFLVVEGPGVSRLLYGQAWAQADTLLAPAAVALSATAVSMAASYVLMGAGFVRKAVAIEATIAVAGLVALAATLAGETPTFYLWTLAWLQLTVAAGALAMATPLVESAWRRRGLWPACASTAAGVMTVVLVRESWAWQNPAAIVGSGVLYVFAVSVALLLTAPALVLEVLRTPRAFRWKSRIRVESEAKA